MRIGIAGYMGAGKSTCARLFESENTQVIDADSEAKFIMSRDDVLQNELRRAFGDDVICEDGGGAKLRFDVLGATVFNSINTLKKFNAIVHPSVVKHLNNIVMNCGKKNCILDAALIPLWDNVATWFDFCVWVDVPFDTRLQRLIAKRNDIDIAELSRRMKLQEEMMTIPNGGNWTILHDSECREFIETKIF